MTVVLQSLIKRISINQYIGDYSINNETREGGGHYVSRHMGHVKCTVHTSQSKVKGVQVNNNWFSSAYASGLNTGATVYGYALNKFGTSVFVNANIINV